MQLGPSRGWVGKGDGFCEPILGYIQRIAPNITNQTNQTILQNWMIQGVWPTNTRCATDWLGAVKAVDISWPQVTGHFCTGKPPHFADFGLRTMSEVNIWSCFSDICVCYVYYIYTDYRYIYIYYIQYTPAFICNHSLEPQAWHTCIDTCAFHRERWKLCVMWNHFWGWLFNSEKVKHVLYWMFLFAWL